MYHDLETILKTKFYPKPLTFGKIKLDLQTTLHVRPEGRLGAANIASRT